VVHTGYGNAHAKYSLLVALAQAAGAITGLRSRKLNDTQQNADQLIDQREALKKSVSDILRRALAGYEDDYKVIISGAVYIQWGRVEKDIHAVTEVALRAAEAERDELAELAAELQKKYADALTLLNWVCNCWPGDDENWYRSDMEDCVGAIRKFL